MGKYRKGEMCGIFAYLNYNVNRERRYILEVLFNGLRRLEYRGYDSAGISIDASSVSDSNCIPPLVFRQEGKIESLVKSVYQGKVCDFLIDFYGDRSLRNDVTFLFVYSL